MSRITITIDVPNDTLMQKLMVTLMHPLMELVAREQGKDLKTIALNDATDDVEMSCVASDDADLMQNDEVSSLTQKVKPTTPSPTTPYSPPSPASPEPDDGDDGFDEFWKAYPRKVCKAYARAHYEKAIKNGASHHAIMHGVERYPFSDEVKFIPHPATWLNQQRWEDVDEQDMSEDLSEEQWAKIIDPYGQMHGLE